MLSAAACRCAFRRRCQEENHKEKLKRRKTAGTVRGLQIAILLQRTYKNGLLRRLQPRPQGKMRRRNTGRSTRRRARAQSRALHLQLALTGQRMMWVAATRTTQLPPQLPSAVAQRLPPLPRCEPVLVSETRRLRKLRISAACRYLTCLPACEEQRMPLLSLQTASSLHPSSLSRMNTCTTAWGLQSWQDK